MGGNAAVLAAQHADVGIPRDEAIEAWDEQALWLSHPACNASRLSSATNYAWCDVRVFADGSPHRLAADPIDDYLESVPLYADITGTICSLIGPHWRP